MMFIRPPLTKLSTDFASTKQPGERVFHSRTIMLFAESAEKVGTKRSNAVFVVDLISLLLIVVVFCTVFFVRGSQREGRSRTGDQSSV